LFPFIGFKLTPNPFNLFSAMFTLSDESIFSTGDFKPLLTDSNCGIVDARDLVFALDKSGHSIKLAFMLPKKI